MKQPEHATTPAEGLPPQAPAQYLALGEGLGSVEHYYHFLLGLLLPLGVHIARMGSAKRPEMILRSCGPLDVILRELGVPELMLWPRQRHEAADAEFHGRPDVERIELERFDLFSGRPAYDGEAVRHAAGAVKALLSQAIRREAVSLSAWGPNRILAVARAAPDPYHVSAEAEVPGAGTSRRAIANQAALEAALSARFPGFRRVKLENMPLARQIALFAAADIVVAQHGAALGNIVWMPLETQVIEIVAQQPGLRFYAGLAEAFAVRHQYAPQIGNFGRVLVSDIVRRVAQAIKQPDAPPRRAPIAFQAAVKLRLWPGVVYRRAREVPKAIRRTIAGRRTCFGG